MIPVTPVSERVYFSFMVKMLRSWSFVISPVSAVLSAYLSIVQS